MTGLALPTTLIFDHPSCAAVADVLLRELTAGDVSPASEITGPDDDERVATIDAMDVHELIRMSYAMESKAA